MKLFFLTIIQVLISSQLLGQIFFEADGKQIKTATIRRTYNFDYYFDDSLTLFFADSVVQYSNAKKTIIKTISYSGFNKKSEPSISIEYFGVNGQDSITRHFNEGKLSSTYHTSYDNIGRIVYHSMKDFYSDSTNDRGFEWFYEYRDSSISTGKIEIQTVFVDDATGNKRFHFRVLNEYDNKNRKIKETRENESNEQMAKSIIFTYNDKDSLISLKVDGMEILSIKEEHLNTKCDIENEYSFAATDYISIKQLILQLLIDNQKLLRGGRCENYFLTLTSKDKQTRLTIVKRDPNHWKGKGVIFTTTENFDRAEEK